MRLDELAAAMGINVDHVRPSTSEDLKLKIAQIAKDPALSKHLPKKFQGPGGAMYDKFGNAINEPKKVSAAEKFALSKAAQGAYNHQVQQKLEKPAEVLAVTGRRFREDD